MDGQSRALNVLWWENPIGEGEYCRRIVRMRIRFLRKCSDIPRNLFASGSFCVVFGNAGRCVIFDSRGRDDDKTSPSRGLDPLCLDCDSFSLFTPPRISSDHRESD